MRVAADRQGKFKIAPPRKQKSGRPKSQNASRDISPLPFVTAPLTKLESPIKSKPGSRQPSPAANRKHIYHREFDGVAGNTTVAVSVKTKSGKDSNRRRSVSASRSSTPTKVKNGDFSKKSDPPQHDSGHKTDCYAETCEFARERLRNFYKPNTDPKQLTWHQRLQERTFHGKSSIAQPLFLKQDLTSHHIPLSAPYHSHCYSCAPPKCKTSQFIDRVSNYVNDEQTASNINYLERATSRTKSSIASSQHTNLSCHTSELDSVTCANQSVSCKLNSSTTVKTKSTLPSSTEVCQDADEFETHNTRVFPSYYHPVTSIVFQCKELKRHLDKSSICYKIVSGIEYNLGRLSSEDFERGFPVNPEVLIDTEAQQNVAQQAAKIKELKALCKTLKQDKISLQRDLSAQLEDIATLKCKEEESRQLSENYKSKWEESLKRVDELSRALTSSAQLVHELQDETKVIPILRSMQTKLNERIDSMLKENELAKLETQKLKLERETMKTVLQNKDIQLQKWRGEMMELEKFVADQMNRIPSMNHQQKMRHFLTIMDHLHQGSAEVESIATTSQESMWTRFRNGNGIDQDQLIDGRGESAMFPRCSSPSSENLSIGPTPSWEQISAISTSQHPSERRDKAPSQNSGTSPPPNLLHGSGEGGSWLQQGPFNPAAETTASGRLPSFSQVEQGPLSEVSPSAGRVVVEPRPRTQQNGGDAITAWLSQQVVLPNPPQTIVDLMPPPSELTHWTDSFDDLEILSNT